MAEEVRRRGDGTKLRAALRAVDQLTASRIDATFLLPFFPRSVSLRFEAPAWEEALERASVRSVETERADVVVISSDQMGQLQTFGALAVLAEGRSIRVAGRQARTYLALPDLDNARILVPLDLGRVLRYVLETRWLPSSRARALRKAAAGRMPGLPRALRRLSRQCLTVAAGTNVQPFLVSGAAELLGEPSLDSFLVCGEGDHLARGAFVCFRSHEDDPSWVVKFARVRAYAEPFERDERGLGLAAAAGGSTAARAPRLLHRFVRDGFESSIESAAVGSNFADFLRSSASMKTKRAIVQAIAGWIVETGLETRGKPARAEVERLRREVLPGWRSVPDSLLAGVDELPGVLQHNDLGAWNIVVNGSSFTVLDWESARSEGLPLWDLWYFLADVLPSLDGDGEDRVAAFRRLFRGEAPSSALLFEWTRRAASAFSIPPDRVGRLATLCWLHHGLSHVPRGESLGRYSGEPRQQWPPEHFPHVWLEDPDLGLGWDRWHEVPRKQTAP